MPTLSPTPLRRVIAGRDRADLYAIRRALRRLRTSAADLYATAPTVAASRAAAAWGEELGRLARHLDAAASAHGEAVAADARRDTDAA